MAREHFPCRLLREMSQRISSIWMSERWLIHIGNSFSCRLASSKALISSSVAVPLVIFEGSTSAICPSILKISCSLDISRL